MASLAVTQPLPMPPPMLNRPPCRPTCAQGGHRHGVLLRPGHGLDATAIAVLRRQAEWLVANPAIMVRLDGHADQNARAIMRSPSPSGGRPGFAISWSRRGFRPTDCAIASWGKERPGTLRIGTSTVGVGPRVVTTFR